MKKILFGSAAALCAVAGLSSFNSSRPSTTFYYWRVIAGSGSKASFINSDLSTFYSTTKPTSNPCASSGTKKCVVGFTVAQITHVSGITILKTNSGLTPQANKSLPYSRLTN